MTARKTSTITRLGRNIGKTINKVGRFRDKLLDSINPFKRNMLSSVQDLTEFEKMLAEINHQAFQQERKQEINGYLLNSRYSDNTTAVYFNESQNHLIIGYRGTKVTDVRDILTDLRLTFEDDTETLVRFNQDLRKFKNIIASFPSTIRITLTGFSLGGSVAIFINSKSDLVNEVIVFNPGVSRSNLMNIQSADNLTIIRTTNDPISALSVSTNVQIKTIPGKDGLIPTHKLENFLTS